MSGLPDVEMRRRFVSAVPAGCAERRGGLSLPSPVMSSSPCCLNTNGHYSKSTAKIYITFLPFLKT